MMDIKTKLYVLYILLIVETITIGIYSESISFTVIMSCLYTLAVFENPKRDKKK